MTPFLQIAVHETSQVGEARRAAGRVALRLGFDETLAGRVALVATELASNLARHARGGRMLVGETADGALELLSLDDGPGMANLEACLRDGYSTAGTPGTGLGAARRLADAFSAYSVAGKGSVIYARLGGPTPGRFHFAGINLAVRGEEVSGDGWQVRVDDEHVAVFVADGLGHGPQAAEASDAALRVFASAPVGAPPGQTLERAHAAMRATRGAAAALAVLDVNAGGPLRYAGAGNITGRLLNALEDRTLLSQHGTLGLQIRKPQDIEYAWPEHGLLVMHSDGIVTRWNLDDAPGLLQCEPAVLAGWLLREHSRGRDDATVVVLRRAR